jgi:glutathione S-transferase
MPLKFYMTPGSCSTGIHILLEEIGRPFEACIVNLLAGEHLRPEFVAINPKSTIPVLVREDGTALSEFQAIAYWLARSFPKARLLPDDEEGVARVIEHLGYVTATIHGQGFTRVFTSDTYSDDPAARPAIEARGRELAARGFAVMDAVLAGHDYLVGERFSIADAALFYVEFWADRIGLPLPPNCRAHYERLRGRPAVRQVLAEEGYR